MAALGLWLAYVMGYLDPLLQPYAQPASVWVEPVGQPSAVGTAQEVAEPAAPSTPVTSWDGVDGPAAVRCGPLNVGNVAGHEDPGDA